MSQWAEVRHLPRGSATFRSAPETHGPSRRQRHRRPGPRLRETGDMNQASDRYPRRLGRVLPGDARSRSAPPADG